MQEDKKLKLLLILQSFCPLFFLIFIRYVGHLGLILRFFNGLIQGDISVVERAWKSSYCGNVVIAFLCVIWFLITVVVTLGFRDFQSYNFAHHGEKINIISEKNDSGATFLVTFVFPLFVDDVSTLRGFIFFIALFTMVIFLLMQTDMFYQNPVLTALGYRSYEFQFVNPYQDVQENKIYIGLSKEEPTKEAVIKRKYIANDVFLICNDSRTM